VGLAPTVLGASGPGMSSDSLDPAALNQARAGLAPGSRGVVSAVGCTVPVRLGRLEVNWIAGTLSPA
jgi:hypothetical protein